MSRIVSAVNTPKLSPCLGLSRREIRSASVASSIACGICATSRGLTDTDSRGREPKIIWNCPSGMTANSSCDWPSSDPRFSLTPTTRKCTPSIWISLSSGSISVPNNRSAVFHPSTATGRAVSTSVGLISRPRSASKLEKFT